MCVCALFHPFFGLHYIVFEIVGTETIVSKRIASHHSCKLREIHFLINTTNHRNEFQSQVFPRLRSSWNAFDSSYNMKSVCFSSNRYVGNLQENRLSTFIIFIFPHLLRLVCSVAFARCVISFVVFLLFHFLCFLRGHSAFKRTMTEFWLCLLFVAFVLLLPSMVLLSMPFFSLPQPQYNMLYWRKLLRIEWESNVTRTHHSPV